MKINIYSIICSCNYKIDFFVDNGKLLLAPESGDTSNITRIYITNINFKRDIDISKQCEEMKLDMESFEYYMQ